MTMMMITMINNYSNNNITFIIIAMTITTTIVTSIIVNPAELERLAGGFPAGVCSLASFLDQGVGGVTPVATAEGLLLDSDIMFIIYIYIYIYICIYIYFILFFIY